MVLGGQGQQTGQVRASFRAVDSDRVYVKGCASGVDTHGPRSASQGTELSSWR